jgi:hypothetical protein
MPTGPDVEERVPVAFDESDEHLGEDASAQLSEVFTGFSDFGFRERVVPEWSLFCEWRGRSGRSNLVGQEWRESHRSRDFLSAGELIGAAAPEVA